ncbi:MAG: hypothetical protein ACTMIZ_12650, partial [Cellulosimicrobium funkei]
PSWVVSVVTGRWDRGASAAPQLLELLADAPACRGVDVSRPDAAALRAGVEAPSPAVEVPSPAVEAVAEAR